MGRGVIQCHPLYLHLPLFEGEMFHVGQKEKRNL